MAIGAVLGTALGVDMARVKDGNDRCSGIYPCVCVAALCWVYLTVGCTMGVGRRRISQPNRPEKYRRAQPRLSSARGDAAASAPDTRREESRGGIVLWIGVFPPRSCQPHDDVTGADRVRGLPVQSPRYSQARENDTQRGTRAGCKLRATSRRDGAGANLGPIRTSKQASLQQDKLKHRRLASWRRSEANESRASSFTSHHNQVSNPTQPNLSRTSSRGLVLPLPSSLPYFSLAEDAGTGR